MATSAKKKYECKYNKSYEKDFTFIIASKKDINHAYCTYCKKDIRISYGGKTDVRDHEASLTHKSNARVATSTPSIAKVFASGDAHRKVSISEGMFAAFVAKHNLSLSTADHFTKLVPKMFPDSDIASKYGCGRTKTTAIIKEALAPTEMLKAVKMCQQSPFGLMVDESNDRGNDKLLVMLARVYNEETSRVETKFIDMPVCNSGTADNMFKAIDKVLSEKEIPWTNVTSFNSDNCSAMKGQRNGLIAKLRSVSPKIVDIGCICHLANLSVGVGLKTSPMNADDLLCDINTHFSHSSKRLDTFKEFQIFVGADAEKLLKHTPTRWLSLRRCLQRLVSQYGAVKSYFASQKDAEKVRSKLGQIHATLNNPSTLPWLLFLIHALEPFSKFNEKFQSEDLLIIDLYSAMERLIKRVMVMLLPVSAVSVPTLGEVDLDAQLSDLDLSVGTAARVQLVILEEEDLGMEEVADFYKSVRKFLRASISKMLTVFPLANEQLKLAPIVNPQNRADYSVSDITRLYTSMCSGDVPETLESEYLDYLCEDINSCTTPELFWGKLARANLPTLCRLMRQMMAMPHSNAASERVFSMLKKVYTEQRPSLGHSTINSLLSFKQNSDSCCFDQDFSPETIKQIKKASRVHNERYSTFSDNVELMDE